jgi:carbon storage regulator CsrA
MLALTRAENESIIITLPTGEKITVTILGKNKIGIDAPREVSVIREELKNKEK